MKKLLLTLSIVLSGIIAVNAQAKTAPKAKDKVADMVAGYKKNCALTPTQETQVKGMVENYYKKQDDITAKWNKDKNNEESVKAQEANKASLDSQVKAILNPDQQAKLEAWLASEKEKAAKAAEKKK